MNDSHILKHVLWECNRKEWFVCMLLPLWLPCSMVRGPVWLVMSGSTYPGQMAFTMRSSRGSALNARCCIKLRALKATSDTEYAELGQPSCWCVPFLALLQIHNEEKQAYTTSNSKTLYVTYIKTSFCIQRYWVFRLCPSFGFEITKNTTFQKLDQSPVIEASSFYGTQQSRCLPSPKDGKRSSFRNVVFLVISNPDDGQSP
jgi:hypothetical protein